MFLLAGSVALFNFPDAGSVQFQIPENSALYQSQFWVVE